MRMSKSYLYALLLIPFACYAAKPLPLDGIYSISFSSTNYHGAVTLIEKDGKLWSSSNYGGDALIGNYHTQAKPEFLNTFPEPVLLSTTIDGGVLTHSLSYKGSNEYFIGANLRQPQTRQVNSDTELVLPPNNYASLFGTGFVLNVTNAKGKFTGSEGNCTFHGDLKDVKNRFYKEVTLTYGPNCSNTDYSSYPYVEKPIKAGLKMQGVLIGTIFNWYTSSFNTMMLIIVDQKETFAVSRLLHR